MIVIPAAGNGARFRAAGYTEPKHLVLLGGKPMIEWVIENVRPLAPLDDLLVLTKDVVGETRGTAETLALAPKFPEQPLVIANCDQLLDFPVHDLTGDGVIYWFRSCSEAHSYLLTKGDRIIGIVEKQVVSEKAVSGVYWFREASEILDACRLVCEREGELYLSGAIQLLIADGLDLRAVEAPTAILGTPEDFQRMEVALALARAV